MAKKYPIQHDGKDEASILIGKKLEAGGCIDHVCASH